MAVQAQGEVETRETKSHGAQSWGVWAEERQETVVEILDTSHCDTGNTRGRAHGALTGDRIRGLGAVLVQPGLCVTWDKAWTPLSSTAQGRQDGSPCLLLATQKAHRRFKTMSCDESQSPFSVAAASRREGLC